MNDVFWIEKAKAADMKIQVMSDDGTLTCLDAVLLWEKPISQLHSMYRQALVQFATGNTPVLVPWRDLRNIPTAEPSPVEHTVEIGVTGGSSHSLALRSHGGDLSQIALSFRDGIPIAYTKDGVRVKLMPRVGDIHKHTWDLNSKLAAASRELAEMTTERNSYKINWQVASQERDEATERAAAYEAAVIKHNEKMDNLPLKQHHPRSAQKGLLWLAEWFDGLYPDNPDTAVQDDLRRWADDAEAARQQQEQARDAEREAAELKVKCEGQAKTIIAISGESANIYNNITTILDRKPDGSVYSHFVNQLDDLRTLVKNSGGY